MLEEIQLYTESVENGTYLKQVAKEKRLFPNGVWKRPSLGVLKRKLRAYREKGIEGLARRGRSDRGRPWAQSEEMIEKAVALKRDQSKRSHVPLN